MGRRIIAIIVAAVLALIGAVMVLLYARSADARAVDAASPRTVYVSAAAIPAGTTIRDAVRLGQLTQTQVPAKGVPVGALTDVNDENSSLLAVTDILPGQYVLTAAFGDQPVGDKKIQVPAGMLAVSVSLSDPARVGNFVTPGSDITVFATASAAAAEPEGGDGGDAADATTGVTTRVLFDTVKVIAIGDTPLQSGAAPAPVVEGQEAAPAATAGGFLVTLAVTPAQAANLVNSLNGFTLYAGLRGSEVKVDPKLVANSRTMFGGN